MSDLHPHWQATSSASDIPATPSPVRAEETVLTPRSGETRVRIPIGGARVSRRPAAILGILVAITVGFTTLQGGEIFRGQTGTPAKSVGEKIEIHITKNGIVPKSIDAAPGQEIVWVNEQEIPHILESETLVSEDGETLYTPAIFPKGNHRFVLAPNHPIGRHSYLSTTSVDVFGEINIVATEDPEKLSMENPPATVTDTPEDEEENDRATLEKELAGILSNEEEQNVTDGTPAPDDRAETIDSSDPLAASVAPPKETSGEPESALPMNPYAVGSPLRHPGSTAAHAGAPKTFKGFRPVKHVSTGPEVWIVGLLSVAGIWMVTRKLFARIRGNL